jgi:flagellar motor switch protein FliG
MVDGVVIVSPSGRTLSKKDLSGPQKCAVLCMALGTEKAVKILQQLTPKEIEQVTREIASMQKVERELIDAVLEEYQSAARDTKLIARGGVEYAHRLLEESLGATESQPFVELIKEKVVDSGLSRLKEATPEILAGILRGEHPQTIALILAHLDAMKASKLLQELDRKVASEVLYRVARMDRIPPEVLALVEKGLNKKADVSLSEEMTQSGGPAAVAKLLNLTREDLDEKLLESIKERDTDLADRIRSLMFIFEDLLQVDSKGMQRILREVESKDLALAMKAASDDLQTHIKSNMSERAAAALEEEIELLGPVRVTDVEAAHARVIDVVRQLDQAGEILIRRQGGSDDIIP